MELFYIPFACSMAPHIISREAELDVDLRKVKLISKALENGDAFLDVNPKGLVPTLRLDNGQILTEMPAVLQYLADQNPAADLTPTYGSLEYFKLMEWINFVGTELHKRILFTFFSPKSSAEMKEMVLSEIPEKLKIISKNLGENTYVLGDKFSTADAYLGWWLILAQKIGAEYSAHDNIDRYLKTILSRPSVRSALKYESEKLADL